MTDLGIYPMQRDEKGFSRDDTELSISVLPDSVVCRLCAQKTEIRMLMLRWRGCWPKGALFLGDAVERSYGNLCWHLRNPRDMMAWYFASNRDEDTYGAGVMTRPDAFCFWSADDEGVTLILDVRCGGKGVILYGKQIVPAVIRQSSYSGCSAFSAMKQFCHLLCDDPLLPQHPAFGSNNWYYSFGKTDADELYHQAEETLQWCGGISEKPYMIIDDGWQEFANIAIATGRPFARSNPRFPDMPDIASKLSHMGCRPGIWVRPVENLDRHYDKGPVLLGRRYPSLDCSVPENLETIGQDIDRVVSWGYELIKYDFVCRDMLSVYVRTSDDLLNMDSDWTLADRSITNALCVKKLCETIYRHAPNITLIGCNVPSHLSAGYLHINRIGDDTHAFSWDRTVINGVNTLAYRLCQHNRFYAVDADCIGIVPEGGIPWEYNRQFMMLIANSKTPFFLSAKPGCMTSGMQQDIRQAFRQWVHADESMEPLDWQDTLLPEHYSSSQGETVYHWYPENGLSMPWKF